ncbi:MAG: group 1 truncated hemoglobin [Bacteroidota bacterium]
MKKQFMLTAALVAALGTFQSCSKDDNKTTTTPAVTLYTRVGGTELVTDPKNSGIMIEKGRLTLRAVVDSSINVIAADAQLAKYFPVLFAELGNGNTTGLTALSENFTDFMCAATGSTNTNYAYSGKNMKDAHDPAKNSRIAVKINNADFDKFVGDIGEGLAKNGVTASNSKQLVDDLVALLYTTQSDIVQQ